MSSDLRLWLIESGADSEQLDTMALQLRDALGDLDVLRVVPLVEGQLPADAKAVDAVSAGALLVTLSQSAEGLLSLITAVRQWLGHARGSPRSVRLEVAGDSLEISDATENDQDKLIELFVRRHSAGDGGSSTASVSTSADSEG